MAESSRSPCGTDTTNWTYAMNDAALPEGGMAPAFPLGVNVVMARVGGVVYAVSGKCAHMACPLFTGWLDGHSLTCPCHGWRFDIRTGHFRDAPEVGIRVYPVRSEAGQLFVSLD